MSQWIIDKIIPATKANARDRLVLNRLFFYHLLLSFVYYLYAVFNPSDSNNYYFKVTEYYRGPNWSDFYGTSTTFIEWTGYPFIHYLGFSYEAMMALFAFFGWIGFIIFYKFFKEQIGFRNELFGYDLIVLIFLLPNLHFWSGSFGKGSFIFLGIALIFYGMSKLNSRFLYLFIGAVLTYHIRPHVMFVLLISAIIGFTFSTKGIGWGVKILMIAVSIGAFAFIYQDVLNMVGIEEGEEITQGLDLTHRATELQKATSGVDITNYSLPLQVFTFLFRPLFVDAPGMLGLIVSFENVFLLYITILFFARGGLGFLIRGDFLVKTAFLSFITVSIALAQISGNLGIAIRQKSQVMMLFLFVIIKLMDEKQMKEYKRKYAIWHRKQMIKKQQEILQQ
ncbi:hypothetical protein [Fulvivirga ligni]|uniref:hypothetical protein n=1 Tax=Fulvivirga ligni TaxID=2904246 RepID=UPI001F355286|nr:hypothetical protein [Fulvivirga ligni]UII23885.1 hypothetical protein LVD16_11705 [Fulvivirga ligni]